MQHKRLDRMISTAAAAALVATLAGCGGGMSETETGAAIGAGAGVVAGGLEAESILAGGAAGALAGAAVDYLNDQEEEIERDIDSWIERPRENALTVNFREGQVFSPMSDQMTVEGRRELDQLADLLARYDATAVVLRSWAADRGLAERRAAAVERFLESEGLKDGRVAHVAYPTDQEGILSVLLMAPAR